VHLSNASRPFGGDFQIGDRFEIVVTGAPRQPVSVRTTTQNRTDWGPVIGWTDSTGQWSTSGQFTRSDFGGGRESWTVGGKLATPAIQFSVNAPCLPVQHGLAFANASGPNIILSCETAEGVQTFSTPSQSDAFRTPDGRMVPGRERSNETAEQYHTQMVQDLITGAMPARAISIQSSKGALGDETAELISKLIGVNALNGDETRNLLAILRAAFAKPETIQPGGKDPSRTLVLLRHLADFTDADGLKREIAETMAYVQGR
jgi:hypothetical protein